MGIMNNDNSLPHMLITVTRNTFTTNSGLSNLISPKVIIVKQVNKLYGSIDQCMHSRRPAAKHIVGQTANLWLVRLLANRKCDQPQICSIYIVNALVLE